MTCGECAVVFSRIMRQQEVSVSGSRVPSTLQHVCRVQAMVGTLPPPCITLHHLASPHRSSSAVSPAAPGPSQGRAWILLHTCFLENIYRYNFAKPRCMMKDMPIGNRYRSIIEAPLTSRLARSGGHWGHYTQVPQVLCSLPRRGQ